VALTLVPNHDDLILAAYFGQMPPETTLASAIDQLQLQGEELGDVTLLDAAVGAIVLKSIRDRLPQWMVFEQGQVTVGRTRVRPVRGAYKPKHLFTLNWADSGPGFSWPLAYHATTVPLFNSMVVTASADGTDAYGFTDFAIGHFGIDVDLVVGARRVIVDNWTRQARDGQERWAYLSGAGLVSACRAKVWADQAWPNEKAEVRESSTDGSRRVGAENGLRKT
jgi:hypothetical protein